MWRYFEEISKNKHLTLVSTNESKEKIKQYQKVWSKTRDLIVSITKNIRKYKKIKFKLDDQLPLNKPIEIPSMIIVVRVVFLYKKK